MSDQTTPPTEEPTAATDSPEGIGEQQTQQAPQTDWERDYKELQREFTRTRQQMTDPEYRAQLAQEWLSQHGYALPDDEPEPAYEDPTDALAARLEALEGQLTERQMAEQRAQEVAELEQKTEMKLAQIQGIDDDDKSWIVTRAISLPPADDGGLDVAKAHAEFVALQQSLQQKWIQSKRAPRPPGNGQQATQTKNVDDMSPEELVAWQVERLQAMER